MDNLVIPRQFVVDLRAAKMMQLRALKTEIAQYDRWLKLSPHPPFDGNDGAPIPPAPNATRLGDNKESEWS